MIRNARYAMDGRVVLLGDAKSTAHFSIGSGTKLAMEDAIGLHQALVAKDGDIAAALAHFETARREEVEKTQHSADVSLVWFEHVKRFWDMDPLRFSFGLMTRAKSITWENLELRAPTFVARSQPQLRGGGEPPGTTWMSNTLPRRCSNRCACATWRCETASSSRRCACIRRRTGCRATSTWSITARSPWAGPA